jgi:hypothetical protein
VLLEERARGKFLAGHVMFPLFLGPEARGWKAAFRKRFPRATSSGESMAGTFRHAIMSKIYEVEVRVVELRGPKEMPHPARWLPTKDLADALTNSLARKVWRLARG